MAGSSSKSDDGKKKARIEIIPLIDVIFFLLATFVLFTLSLKRIKSIPVTLPAATPSVPQEPNPEDVTLQVSDHGTYYWNKDPISVNELGPKLTDYRNRVTSPHILITGDYGARFGATVLALDEVRKAHIDAVSVETTGARQTGK